MLNIPFNNNLQQPPQLIIIYITDHSMDDDVINQYRNDHPKQKVSKEFLASLKHGLNQKIPGEDKQKNNPPPSKTTTNISPTQHNNIPPPLDNMPPPQHNMPPPHHNMPPPHHNMPPPHHNNMPSPSQNSVSHNGFKNGIPKMPANLNIQHSYRPPQYSPQKPLPPQNFYVGGNSNSNSAFPKQQKRFSQPGFYRKVTNTTNNLPRQSLFSPPKEQYRFNQDFGLKRSKFNQPSPMKYPNYNEYQPHKNNFQLNRPSQYDRIDLSRSYKELPKHSPTRDSGYFEMKKSRGMMRSQQMYDMKKSGKLGDFGYNNILSGVYNRYSDKRNEEYGQRALQSPKQYKQKRFQNLDYNQYKDRHYTHDFNDPYKKNNYQQGYNDPSKDRHYHNEYFNKYNDKIRNQYEHPVNHNPNPNNQFKFTNNYGNYTYTPSNQYYTRAQTYNSYPNNYQDLGSYSNSMQLGYRPSTQYYNNNVYREFPTYQEMTRSRIQQYDNY